MTVRKDEGRYGYCEYRQVCGGTKVTHEGVKKLQEALPNCKIARYPLPLTK